MQFEFNLDPSAVTRPLRLAGPVRRLLILSDLRGNGAGGAERLLDRPLVKVDLDNLDIVLARYAPAVQLGVEAGGERVDIRSFDDLHPNRLVDTLAVFRALRDVRARLGHPSTFAAAAAELQRDVPPPSETTAASADPALTTEGAGSTLERLLGHRPAAPAGAAPSLTTPRPAAAAADALIRQAVAPHIVPAPSPQLPQMLAAVDAAMTDLLRAVLHDPAFQAVEAAWRSIQWLVSTLELDETLELYLLHVTREELTAGAVQDGDLWRRLVERETRADGGLRLSAIVGNFSFGPGADDVAVLEAVGGLAEALETAFVAHASAACLGTDSVASHPDPREWTFGAGDDARWKALRMHPSAAHVGLAAPRLLLRLPYGRMSDPIAAFRFEEQPPSPRHDWFLWGNPAFACGAVVARVLAPDADMEGAATFAGLPAFVYTADDESQLQPPAEIAPTEAAVVAIQARGVMPLVSYRNRDVVRLTALQSVASPPTGLLR